MKQRLWVACLVFMWFGAAPIAVLSAPQVTVIEAPRLTVDKESRIVFSVQNAGKAVTPPMLDRPDEEQLHVVLLDLASLSDYRFIYPKPEGDAGHYAFSFKPISASGYRMWVNVPMENGKSTYVMTDIAGQRAAPSVAYMQKSIETATIDGFSFALFLDTPPYAGQMTTGHITVEVGGVLFGGLEPIRGNDVSRMMALSSDGKTLIRVYPYEQRPDQTNVFAGPLLDFYFIPKHKGFMKFFVQVRVSGKDIVAPLGLIVK